VRRRIFPRIVDCHRVQTLVECGPEVVQPLTEQDGKKWRGGDDLFDSKLVNPISDMTNLELERKSMMRS